MTNSIRCYHCNSLNIKIINEDMLNDISYIIKWKCEDCGKEMSSAHINHNKINDYLNRKPGLNRSKSKYVLNIQWSKYILKFASYERII